MLLQSPADFLQSMECARLKENQDQDTATIMYASKGVFFNEACMVET